MIFFSCFEKKISEHSNESLKEFSGDCDIEELNRLFIESYNYRRIGKFKNAAKIEYDLAYCFERLRKFDSAYFYFKKSKNGFLRENDSVNVARCILSIAILKSNFGNYYGNHINNIQALSFLESSRDSITYAAIYNSLAISNRKLKRFSEAIYWYNKAINISKDQYNSLMYSNNISNTYVDLKEYDKAITILDSISQISEVKEHPNLQAKIIDNLAYARWKKNHTFNPVTDFKKALKIRKENNDELGLIASYAHLSDYYQTNNLSEANKAAHAMLQASKKANSPDDQLEALQKVIKTQTNNKTKYFERYIYLYDSLQTARTDAQNKFALIEFDAEKNRAENLELQNKISQKTIQNQKVITWLIVLLSVFLLSAVIIYFVYENLKKKAKQKEILSVHETELKLSQKIHDEIANDTHQLLVSVQKNMHKSPQFLEEKLNHLYQKARNISREYDDIDVKENFVNDLIDMIKSFENENVKILTNPINSDFWENVEPHKKRTCYRVLQEILVNMRKHSQATFVEVSFLDRKKNIQIEYEDNGIGFNSSKKLYKNGLYNVETRIQKINGTVSFDSVINQGTKILIQFPKS